MTRGSITGQVKALSMIVAMLNLIPDRRALSAEKKSTPAPAQAQIYARQQATTIDPQPTPVQQEDAPPDPGPSRSAFANRVSTSEAAPRHPYVPLFNSVPDLGVGLSMIKNPFVDPR
jgi:hypothetical protein